MYKLIIHKTPQEFLDSNNSNLLQNELENNIPLGVSMGLDNKNIENPNHRFISVTDNYKTKAISVNISPRMMISCNQDHKGSIELITDYFNNSDFPVTSVIGKKGIPERFAKNFKLKKRSVRDLVAHTLSKTNDIKIKNGKLETADITDLQLLAKFRYDFDVYTFGNSRLNEIDLINETESFITKKNLFVWKVNDEIVSMAKIMRNTINIAIIGRVFTPEKYRGNGFGTAIVHSLSNEILKRGVPVCGLFTDKLNLASTYIYAKIGFKPEIEFSDIYFDKK